MVDDPHDHDAPDTKRSLKDNIDDSDNQKHLSIKNDVKKLLKGHSYFLDEKK